MNILLILRTVVHLKPMQLVFQVKGRLSKSKYKSLDFRGTIEACSCVPFIPKYRCLKNDTFSFLNISDTFSSWNTTTNGMLWAYNLNYMDWLQQEEIGFQEASAWIDRFIYDLPQNKIGLDPYPIALRSINWIKFIVQQYDNIGQEKLCKWNSSLYSQFSLLEKKLEYHLLGNHLLEDAYALFIGAIYFKDKRMFEKYSKLLLRELKEQILSDGAHYEQSPMYHCVLLDRLLDCYNFAVHNERFSGQKIVTQQLKNYCLLMLGHLESIVYADKTYPLFNDSANGIAPDFKMLIDYAERLELQWQAIPLGTCGYRKFQTERMEVMVDIGNITAIYQAGHTHADTFTYELRFDGKPIVVDTGVSTYNKSSRRQYERSTEAHNTVTISKRNSSEVWGGFRMGKRAKVQLIQDDICCVEAKHNGYGTDCYRKFSIDNDTLIISERIKSEAISHIHLWHEERVEKISQNEIVTTHARIKVENADHLELRDEMISTEYNVFLPIKVIDIFFKEQIIYNISIR